MINRVILLVALQFIFVGLAIANNIDNPDYAGVDPTSEEVNNWIKQIKLDKTKTSSEKNKEIQILVSKATSYLKYEDAIKVMQGNEDIFFVSPNSLSDALDQANFIMFSLLPLTNNNNSDDRKWFLRHTYKEFISQLKNLLDTKECDADGKCYKFADDPLMKIFLINPILSSYYEGEHDWENRQKITNETLDILERNEKYTTSAVQAKCFDTDSIKWNERSWAGYRKFLMFISHREKLEYLIHTGSFPEILKENDYLKDNFKQSADWLINDGKIFPSAMNSILIKSYLADQYLGNYNGVINKATYLLDHIPKTSKYRATGTTRSLILKDLAEAYRLSNKRDLQIKCLLEALSIESDDNRVDVQNVSNLILDAIYQHDLLLAQKYNSIINQQCSKMIDSQNVLKCQATFKENELLLNKLLGLDPSEPVTGKIGIAFNKINEMTVIVGIVPNKPAEQSGIKEGDYLLQINGIDTKNLSLEKTYELLKGKPNEKVDLLISKNEKDLPKKYELIRSASVDDVKIIRDYWLNVAFRFENTINPLYDLKGGTFESDQIALNLYRREFGYFMSGGNNYLAAIYAKKYINLLQKLRSQLSTYNANTLKDFTENQSSDIKIFANVFYDIGQYDAAWACQRIIQENEFLDYVRRSGIDKDFLSTVSNTNVESDYLIKTNNNAKENDDLNKKLSKLKGKENTAEYKLIAKAIDQNIKALDSLRKTYSQILKDESVKKIAQGSEPISLLNLRDDEAAIQFILNDNQLTIFVSLKNKNERFIQPVNVNALRETMQQMIISAATQKKISEDSIVNISDIFLKQPAQVISQNNIKKLKISMDNTLSSFPLSFLRINGKNINETYSIEKIGIGRLKALNGQKIKQSVIAFAATKGNSEFSSLPGASKEVEKIMNIKSSEQYSVKQSFIDDKFNLKSFISALSNNNDFVHIATHFRIDGNTANTTKMLLGDGSTLSLEDLRGDLPSISADLITLSACNTGQQFMNSKKQTFDGLSSTFQVKGVKNVISTLWEISDDATADFMTIFYSLLLNNKIAPSEALAYTQTLFNHGSINALPSNIILIEDKITSAAINNLSKYSNPYYWAAFQISTIN